MEIQYVNVCGIPKEKFVDGKCVACGSVCDMSDRYLVDIRVWKYAQKHTGIPGGMLNKNVFAKNLKESGRLEKAPKYVKNYVLSMEEEKMD